MPTNLQEIFRKINSRYFQNRIIAEIKWGRNRTPTYLGIYHRRKIKINPLLDQWWVPKGYLSYVVYHEMLHQAVKSRRTPGGRIYHHTPQFRKREKLFHQAAKWDSWERYNFHRFRKIKGDFKKYGHRFNLWPEDFGKTVVIDKIAYQIAGLHPWALKRPVVLRNGRQLTRFPAKAVVKKLAEAKKALELNRLFNAKI